MNDPLDPQSAAPGKGAATARRLRAIRGSTAALTVSLVIAFSATVANREDLGEAVAADPGQTAAGGLSPTANAGTVETIAQPERLVTRQS